METTPTNTIARDIENYLTFLRYEKRYSSHSIAAYTNDLKQFVEFLYAEYALKETKAVALLHARIWLTTLSEQKYTVTSLRRKISALKSFLQYAVKKNIITHNPIPFLSLPKKQKNLISFLNKSEMEKLFHEISFPNTWEGLTDRLILETFYATGIRLSELVFLQTDKINCSNNTLIVQGKGGKERLIPLSEYLSRQLSDYIHKRREKFTYYNSPMLWVNEKGRPLYVKYVYKKVKKYLSYITTSTQKSPHTLRHTFATHLIHEGAAIGAIKELLGHSSLASTQIYTHNNISHLKDIYKKAHPKS